MSASASAVAIALAVATGLGSPSPLPPAAALGGLEAVDPAPAHLVGIGGAIGAILRHLTSVRLPSGRFPWPTLAVNAVGSFVLGLATFSRVGETTMLLLGVGVCGAFTTFSTFSLETVELYERGDRLLAAVNAAGTLIASLAAIGVAWALTAVGPL
ncbi:fluoride efflux transporter CrcB [Natrialbaceae archaeon GCM10025810]|uniref:fluoride efflux transporter CrcB n=1 Tax=Halovalidus salilacus TaxID=3075124 RepID=UPI0036229E10